MEQSLEKLTAYLNSARSVFHAVAGLAAQLEGEGYALLSEGQPWQLEKGGKYYLTRGGSSLIAFRVPKGEALGFAMTASHSDRPTFKVKENGELVSAYTRLAVERYGGMLIAPWLDRPLSVAGRVVVKTPQGIQSRLVDMDQDLAMIPNVAIHMNRQANEGYKWNPATDVLPLLGTKQSAGKFFAALENQAGGQILGHDLTLYVRESARVWGMDSEFISAPALDDLQCAFGCAQGFLNAGESGNIPVLCVFDSEEVGSGSLQGAASDLLEATLSRVCEALRLDKRIMLSMDGAKDSHNFLLGGQRNGAGDGCAVALCGLHDLCRAGVDQLMIISLQPDADHLVCHGLFSSLIFVLSLLGLAGYGEPLSFAHAAVRIIPSQEKWPTRGRPFPCRSDIRKRKQKQFSRPMTGHTPQKLPPFGAISCIIAVR